MMPLSMAETGRMNQIRKVGGKEETRRFLESLGFVVGGFVTVVSEMNGNRGCFLMTMEETGAREGYRISVTEDGIVLDGGGEAGLLYAVQTMRQLIRQFGARIPAVEIADEPAIANRGFYQDVSRGRIPTFCR